MKATDRVFRRDGELAGFIVDGQYMGYYTVADGIDMIENLRLENGRFSETDCGKLGSVTLTDVNKVSLEKLCRESPFVRDIQKDFEYWLSDSLCSQLILYLSGARQTGKTTELLKLGYSSFEQVIYVDLSQKNILDKFVSCVVNGSNKAMGMTKFCMGMGEKYSDSDSTFLIIDEIQESSEVYNALRSLRKGLRCKIAATGSYLARILTPSYFKPAGDTFDLEMLPLSFREFARVFELEDKIDGISIFGKSEQADYEVLTRLYENYIQVGGYPAAVNAYLKDGIQGARRVLKTLIARFVDESSAYFKDDRCRSIFLNTFKAALLYQISEKKGTAKDITGVITNFIKQDSKMIVSRAEVNEAVVWLIYSGILGTCDLYNGEKLDLLPDRRVYFKDCGILGYVNSLVITDDSNFKGLLAETFAYNELYRIHQDESKALKGDKPCCAVSNGYELDFLLVSADGRRYGVEIKSKRGEKPKSLGHYTQRNIVDMGIIAEITMGGKGEKLFKIPIYMVGEGYPYEKHQ